MRFKRTEVGQHTYTTVLDNHQPPRSYHSGVLTEWEREEDPDDPLMVLEPESPFMGLYTKAAGGISFILDDGNLARPFYITGWQPKTGELFLHPFPTNPNGKMRRDGRVIDYDSWILGPRKTYHLKTTPIVEDS